MVLCVTLWMRTSPLSAQVKIFSFLFSFGYFESRVLQLYVNGFEHETKRGDLKTSSNHDQDQAPEHKEIMNS